MPQSIYTIRTPGGQPLQLAGVIIGGEDLSGARSWRCGMRFDEAKAIVEKAFGLGKIPGGTLVSYSPINGMPLGRVQTGGAEAAREAVGTAAVAARLWAEVPAPKRGEVIAEIGRELALCKD